MRLPGLCVAAAWGLGEALLSLPVHAEQPLWELGFGAAALRLPHYRGANQSSGWVLPVPYLVYRGRWLRADREGARAELFNGNRLDIDLSFGASAPTKSHEDTARQGMPDLAPTVEMGPKLNLHLGRGPDWKLDLRVPVRSVITATSKPRGVGWSAAPVLNLDLRLSAFDLGLQAGPLWGDRRLHRYFYEVMADQATASRPAYQARGGYAGWQATAGVSRRFDQAWVGAFLRHDSVAGAAFADSPLVTSGNQWAFGVALAWVFARSSEQVSEPR